MKKSFHIPLYFKEDEIKVLGESLLLNNTYQAIEIKFPYDMVGFSPESYETGIDYIIKQYNPIVSMHIPTFLDLGIASKTVRQAVISQIKASIDFGVSKGAKVFPFHPATIGNLDVPSEVLIDVDEMLVEEYHKKKEKAAKLTIEGLIELSEYASQYKDAVIAVENVLLPQEIVYFAPELIHIVDSVSKENVKALLDIGHAHRVGADYEDYIYQLGDRICHVHVNDNDGRCDHHMQFGRGNIEYKKVFDAFKKINYNGLIVVETAYDGAADLLESANYLSQYMRRNGDE